MFLLPSSFDEGGDQCEVAVVSINRELCREDFDGVAVGEEPHGDFKVHGARVGCSGYRGSGHAGVWAGKGCGWCLCGFAAGVENPRCPQKWGGGLRERKNFL